MKKSLILTNRNFRLLWLGQLVSQMGNKVHLLAMAWYLVDSLQDKTTFVVMLLLGALPTLVLGTWAGPWIERWNKKHVLVWTDVVSGIISLLLGGFLLHSQDGRVAIVAAVFALNSLAALFNPATRTIIPEIVNEHEFQEATSLHSLVEYGAQFAGAALGGLLMALVGPAWAVLLNGVSFLLSALSESQIRHTHRPTSVTFGRHWDALREGLAFIRSDRALFQQIVVAMAINLFAIPIVIYLPVLVSQELMLGARVFGIAEAALPVGCIVISLVLARVSLVRHLRLICMGNALAGLGFVALLLARGACGLYLAMFLIGVSLSLVNVSAFSWYYSRVRADLHGRFFATMEAIAFSSFPVAFVAAGALLGAFPVTHLLTASACGILVAAAWGAIKLWSHDGFEKPHPQVPTP